MRDTLIKAILAVSVVLVLAVTGFYWNESRMEIKFLCGNFTAGVTQDSVIRQLETGNLLRYETEPVKDGSRISVDSLYTFSIYQCHIELDRDGIVTGAHYGNPQ